MIEINFYYDEFANYPAGSVAEILQMLDTLSEIKEVGIHVSKFERRRLSERAISKIIDEIRSIKPQARGSVVTSGGNTLPLSGSKKLNLTNTPVILIRNSKGPIYVFPCKIGEAYYSIPDGLRFLLAHLPALPELPHGTEESITSVILEAPEILESGLKLLSSEIETSRGRGDLLFEDKNGRPLLVEVEREATDQSVGQILRLCAGLESKKGTGLGSVRAAIACIRINENVLAAAKRAGIEIWKINLNNTRDIKDASAQRTEYFPA